MTFDREKLCKNTSCHIPLGTLIWESKIAFFFSSISILKSFLLWCAHARYVRVKWHEIHRIWRFSHQHIIVHTYFMPTGPACWFYSVIPINPIAWIARNVFACARGINSTSKHHHIMSLYDIARASIRR